MTSLMTSEGSMHYSELADSLQIMFCYDWIAFLKRYLAWRGLLGRKTISKYFNMSILKSQWILYIIFYESWYHTPLLISYLITSETLWYKGHHLLRLLDNNYFYESFCKFKLMYQWWCLFLILLISSSTIFNFPGTIIISKNSYFS